MSKKYTDNRSRLHRQKDVHRLSALAERNVSPALILFNKPYGVLCQFTDTDQRVTLASFLDVPGYYPAGRLDRDSEGLLLLTNDGSLQQRISHPQFKLTKTYLVQVEGNIDKAAISALNKGVTLKDGPAKAIDAREVKYPELLWPRDPPVRFRKQIPTSWIELGLSEGRNRQVRRMTASVGFPTLRLVRTSIGKISVWSIKLGEFRFSDASVLS